MLVFHRTPFHQLHLNNETGHYGQTEGFHFANENKWFKSGLLVIRSIKKMNCIYVNMHFLMSYFTKCKHVGICLSHWYTVKKQNLKGGLGETNQSDMPLRVVNTKPILLLLLATMIGP